jgi:hypothetical protein
MMMIIRRRGKGERMMWQRKIGHSEDRYEESGSGGGGGDGGDDHDDYDYKEDRGCNIMGR